MFPHTAPITGQASCQADQMTELLLHGFKPTTQQFRGAVTLAKLPAPPGEFGVRKEQSYRNPQQELRPLRGCARDQKLARAQQILDALMELNGVDRMAEGVPELARDRVVATGLRFGLQYFSDQPHPQSRVGLVGKFIILTDAMRPAKSVEWMLKWGKQVRWMALPDSVIVHSRNAKTAYFMCCT